MLCTFLVQKGFAYMWCAEPALTHFHKLTGLGRATVYYEI